MTSKKEIRKKIKGLKEALTKEEIAKYSDAIAEKLIQSDFYKASKVIYPYVAYNQEVITDKIIQDAWDSGKRVAVPKVIDDHMEFMYITSFDQLELGYCDIPEPTTTDIADEPEILIVMPGIAFDPDFNRIGYGGGFYDKYLSAHAHQKFVKVALTYDFQILDHLETEEHDYKVDAIVTPTKVYQA